jgi:Protein of unknown function (DUF3822)
LPTNTLHIQAASKTESERFDIEKLNQYTLSCEISDTSLQCQVLEPLDNEAIIMEKYNFPIQKEPLATSEYLKAIYATHDFLKSLKWKSVEIIIDNQSFTLVPTDLYKKEYTNRYLQLAKGKLINEGEEVHTHTHTDLGIVNVYSTDRDLYNWLSETYPLVEMSYKHKTSQLIDFGVFTSKAQTGFIHFGNHFFTLVITANGSLKFCNRFEYKTSQDLVYYVLFTMNELGIEPDEIILRLYGNIIEQSEDFDLLNQFLPNVKMSVIG